MKNVAVNPYLPPWEYVPDGEPHLFEGRVYVFGSHDKAHGTAYCQEDYVVWSAPENDLSDWRCDGVSYRKEQDPHNMDGQKELWAPDVCCGADGRYYLYYCLAFTPEFGVAVSERPEGPYTFYGHVRHQNGDIWREDLPFDPGILFEDENHIWLFSGFGPVPLPESEGLPIAFAHPSKQCSCLRLAPDMKTVLEVHTVAPVQQNAQGTSFEEHPFFEAASPRKIGNTYFLVYSSFQGHELCYATSQCPYKDFAFNGVIISNGDLGYNGNTKRKAYTANNHGGMVLINGQWYIFYHRHTHGKQFSRQGCAEPITILQDGRIAQVEMTSCGLNGGPLPANRRYQAYICCNIMGPDGAKAIDYFNALADNDPYMLEENNKTAPSLYVHNLRKGSVCAMKYLMFNGESEAILTLRGKGSLQIRLDSQDGAVLFDVCVHSKEWVQCPSNFAPLTGVHAIYFVCVETAHYIDFYDFICV